MNALYKLYCRCFQRVMYVAEYFLPWRVPEQISGEGSLAKLPAFAKAKGFKSALLVTDQGLMSLGMAQPIIDGFKAEGLNIAVYDKVVPNPTITNIEEGLKLYKDNNCDVIIALGGGSPMDCAKGIGARVARPRKSIPKMKGLLRVMRKLPPLVAIPTTSGTGSEATLAAVISNPDTHEKYPINDPVLIPHYAVMDPLLTVGLPKHITSTTGMDALTHAVEAYIGSENTRNTKKYAIEATQLVFKYLKRAYDNGQDKEARNMMQKASLLAGMAFTRAYVGYVHAIAHSLGGFYGVPHGLANAVILPHVLDAYGEKAHKKLAQLADAVGIKGANDAEKAKAFIQAIKDMNAAMDIPTQIEGKWTIKEEDIPTMVERALSEANPLYPVPVIWGKEEMAAMYREIM
ncbi:MAG TPA: iron-containing alcohol dehydrogenase [Candidatus Limadaptatus stercorigallinarum]|uniref:Iron-containing alcohol dehydrogenase n=1 Tax=Candidatus Limadaptatus stercorigallinarum TaxID=2840845 RepID=A0A9D1L1P8_9FIRM|nr:iron-containing alcohol dehydrogenase [Candidatus Limadaptatus stercorigallinarum]